MDSLGSYSAGAFALRLEPFQPLRVPMAFSTGAIGETDIGTSSHNL